MIREMDPGRGVEGLTALLHLPLVNRPPQAERASGIKTERLTRFDRAWAENKCPHDERLVLPLLTIPKEPPAILRKDLRSTGVFTAFSFLAPLSHSIPAWDVFYSWNHST